MPVSSDEAIGGKAEMNSLVDMHRVKRLLCLGAHPDDIELRAGGTVMRLIEQNPGLRIRWVVFCGFRPCTSRGGTRFSQPFYRRCRPGSG